MRRETPVLLATNTYGLLGGEVNGVAYATAGWPSHEESIAA